MLCACFTTSGNNYFGEDIVRVLQEVKSEKRRAAYILMDRIRPRTDLNVLLRRGLPLKITSVCCELGICGAYVRYSIHSAMQHACDKMTKKQWQNRFLNEHGKTVFSYRHGEEMVLNEVPGHILRTKSIEHNDAGILAGVSVSDNPLISWRLLVANLVALRIQCTST